MSIYDVVTLKLVGAEATRTAGASLAKTLYKKPLTVTLSGDLGAGKTTFVQGFAEAIGIHEHIASPTYALHQEYGNTLSHIDLYRLKPKEADVFLATLGPPEGIRFIEWPSRATGLENLADIHLVLEGDDTNERKLTCTFRDATIPRNDEIARWTREIQLPENVTKHMNVVCDVALQCAKVLERKGKIVRLHALAVASLTHDLLRCVDFKENEESKTESSTPKQKLWSKLREKYGTSHEEAAQKFLTEHGYPALGSIVRPHRGYFENPKEEELLQTTEQKILCYADKRVLHDSVVSLSERFTDLELRYGHESDHNFYAQWKKNILQLEEDLFDGHPPPIG